MRRRARVRVAVNLGALATKYETGQEPVPGEELHRASPGAQHREGKTALEE
jgi:hypothetical protein